jgi:hypothetical protein
VENLALEGQNLNMQIWKITVFFGREFKKFQFWPKIPYYLKKLWSTSIGQNEVRFSGVIFMSFIVFEESKLNT